MDKDIDFDVRKLRAKINRRHRWYVANATLQLLHVILVRLTGAAAFVLGLFILKGTFMEWWHTSAIRLVDGHAISWQGAVIFGFMTAYLTITGFWLTIRDMSDGR